MTLDEGIKFAEEYERSYSWGSGNIEKQWEYHQIAGWLKELKGYREIFKLDRHILPFINYCPNCGVRLKEVPKC